MNPPTPSVEPEPMPDIGTGWCRICHHSGYIHKPEGCTGEVGYDIESQSAGRPCGCKDFDAYEPPDPWHDGSPSEVDEADHTLCPECQGRRGFYDGESGTEWDCETCWGRGHIWADRLVGALDDLAAERASLAALLKERDSLKAEIMKWEKVLPIATSNGGMRTTADSTLAWLNDHFVEDVQTEADNDRLREALERIARSDEPIHRCGFWRSSVDIARTALAPPTPRTKGEGE